MDRKMPDSASAARMTSSGVDACSRAMIARQIDDAATAISSTGRIPNRRISGVVAGLMATFPANKAMITTPACALDQPNPSWKNSGSRNGIALITNRYSEPPPAVTRKLAMRRMRRSSNGREARSRYTTAVDRNTAASARPVATTDQLDGPMPMFSMPTSRALIPNAVSANPRQSSRGLPSARTSGTSRVARKRPAIPKWQVDDEDPAPGRIGAQHASDGRSDDRRDERRPGEKRDRLDQLGLGGGPEHDEPPDRHHHRAAHALQDPGRGQHRQAGGQCAAGGGQGENRDRRHEDAARTEAIGHPPADRNQYGQGEQVPVSYTH